MSISLPSFDQARLGALVLHARRHSRYYAEAFAALPDLCPLAALPLIDTSRFWHIDGDLASWAALTAPLRDGYVFRSGGSTGQGKWSLCTRREWDHLCACYGAAVATRLAPGDRVGNLFFSGNLYASHLFIQGALSHVDIPICVYPFAGMSDMETLAQGLREHAVNVLAGVPAHLVQLAGHLDARSTSLPRVQTILYGGDSMFADQLALLAKVFPGACVASIGYASVEIGVLGASLPDCSGDEHRCFDGETILEIVDEDNGEIIDAPGQPGLLVATSLTRRLTPIIRCPTGDLASWVEPSGVAQRKFSLAGRSDSGHQVRVGYATLVPAAIGKCIVQALDLPALWQLLLAREAGVDCVTVRVAAPPASQHADKLLAGLLLSQPGLAELVQVGQARLDIQWCAPAELQVDARTGKLRRVIDGRCNGQSE